MVNGRPLWQLLVAVWFLLWGVLAVSNITFTGSAIVLGVIAILAAACWFLKVGGA